MSHRLRATLLLLMVNFFWGLSYVFMKLGLESLEPFNIVALRFLIAFIFAGMLFFPIVRRTDWKTLQRSFILGSLLFLVFTFVTHGVNYTTAANAGFLLSFTVIFVPLIHAVLTRKLPSIFVQIGLVFALIGIGILTLDGQLSVNLGDVLCIIGAFFYAMYIIVTGKYSKKSNPILLGVVQLGFTGILALFFSFLFESPALPSSTNAWIAILGLAILCSAIGFIVQVIAQQYTTPVHTGLMFATEPIFAALSAVIFLGELFLFDDFIGASFIIIGIVLAQLRNTHVQQ